MTWVCSLSHKAEKQLQHLIAGLQKRIAKAIDELEEDPFQGDVKSLKGKHLKGRYRKRVGQYRIIFTINQESRIVPISAIISRSEKTYR